MSRARPGRGWRAPVHRGRERRHGVDAGRRRLPRALVQVRPGRGSARAPLLFVLAPDDSPSRWTRLPPRSPRRAHAGAAAAARLLRGLGPGMVEPRPGPAGLAFIATVAEDAARAMDARGARPDPARSLSGGPGTRRRSRWRSHARRDTRALVLVAPRLPLVELAETRARLRALGTRTYVQPARGARRARADLLSRRPHRTGARRGFRRTRKRRGDLPRGSQDRETVARLARGAGAEEVTRGRGVVRERTATAQGS